MHSNVLKRVTFEEIFKKMNEFKQFNDSRTDFLYIEMHTEALRDLLADPQLDSYMNFSRATVVGRDNIESLLGARIFTHTDSSRRFVLTFAYRADVLMGDKS